MWKLALVLGVIACGKSDKPRGAEPAPGSAAGSGSTTAAQPSDAPPVAADAAAPVEPTPAGSFADYPVGVVPCAVVGIGDVSTILGAQMQYISPAPDAINCQLLPAVGKTAARTAGQVTASEAVAQVPDLLVGVRGPNDVAWSGASIDKLGDKATWEGDAIQVQVGDRVFRIVVLDPAQPPETLKDRALAVARTVVKRASR